MIVPFRVTPAKALRACLLPVAMKPPVTSETNSKTAAIYDMEAWATALPRPRAQVQKPHHTARRDRAGRCPPTTPAKKI